MPLTDLEWRTYCIWCGRKLEWNGAAEFYPGGVTLIVPLAEGSSIRSCLAEVISPDGRLYTVTDFVLHLHAEGVMWAEMTKLGPDPFSDERTTVACLVTAVRAR